MYSIPCDARSVSWTQTIQRADLSKIVSNNKYLNYNEQSMLRDILNKYEFLYDGTLRTWKEKPVDIELQPGTKLIMLNHTRCQNHTKPFYVRNYKDCAS